MVNISDFLERDVESKSILDSLHKGLVKTDPEGFLP